MCIKFILGGGRDSAKIDSELGKSDLNNFENLVELLWHRVQGEDRNIENYVQNVP